MACRPTVSSDHITAQGHSLKLKRYTHSFVFSACRENRYMEIPVVSRIYLTGAFLTTAACAVDIISPFSLYYNWELIVNERQLWRLLTPYLFFGVFSVDFLFHMYFLVRYSRLLEEGDFSNRTANYLYMLLFGISLISLVASYTHVHFLGSALTFMMSYVWGRRNEDVRMSFLGFITFNVSFESLCCVQSSGDERYRRLLADRCQLTRACFSPRLE
jgi:Der1-like family